MRIRQELKDRGVGDDLIEQSLEAAAIDWQELAEQVRVKRFGSGAPEDYRERIRQSRFLFQRGFSSEQISRLFRPID